MAEIKPCPFCGRTPTVDDCGDHRYFVRCKCGIAQDKLYAQKCDAVRRWNTRKTEKFAKDTNVPSTDSISRQAAIEALGEKPLAWTEGDYELGLQNQWQSDVDALKALPAAQPERTCVNCGRTVNNGGWYADGGTRCPIEEHYALPKDGYCHLWEERNIADDDYPERREE